MKLPALALLTLLSVPAAASLGPALDGTATTAESEIREAALARLGRVPDTVIFDSGEGPRVVSWDEAFAMLRTLDPAAPRAVPALPVTDVGYAARLDGGPCYVAAVVTAYRYDTEDALDFAGSVELAPQPTVPCGPGTTSWIGTSRGTVREGTWEAFACVAFEGPIGGWANSPHQCHFGDFGAAEIAGRVGRATIRYQEGDFAFTVQQIVGGLHSSPLPAHADGAVIRIE